MNIMYCRHCKSELALDLINLGSAPFSNSYLTYDQLEKPEINYPLHVQVCENCFLVQTRDYIKPSEVFTNLYQYFSSVSTSWVEHARLFAKQITKDLGLDSKSLVVEIASNDGYLLQHFNELGVPNFGIEPTESTATIAKKIGIETLEKFFTEELALDLKSDNKMADLIVGNNVYAHVPDINDFTAGMKQILKPNGVIVLEFPHLLSLMENTLFDTIYHEHFSYLSLTTVQQIFNEFGLRVWNVTKIPTHGGSLRIFGCHIESNWVESNNVASLMDEEFQARLFSPIAYLNFQKKSLAMRNNFLNFLITHQDQGKKVIAYGAAAKGNTLLNFAGIKSDLISYVVDGAESKQGMYLPGSHIPIYEPVRILKKDFDSIIILPWNLTKEISNYIKQNLKIDAKLYSVVPKIQLL